MTILGSHANKFVIRRSVERLVTAASPAGAHIVVDGASPQSKARPAGWRAARSVSRLLEAV